MLKSYFARRLASKIDCTYLADPFVYEDFISAVDAVDEYGFYSLCTYSPLYLSNKAKNIIKTKYPISFVINFPPKIIDDPENGSIEVVIEEITSIKDLIGGIPELDIYLPEYWSLEGKVGMLEKIAKLLKKYDETPINKIIINIENCFEQDLDDSLVAIQEIRLPGKTIIKTSTGKSKICNLYKDLANKVIDMHGIYNYFDGTYTNILGNGCQYIIDKTHMQLKVAGNIKYYWQIRYLIDRFGEKIDRFGISYQNAIRIIKGMEDRNRVLRNTVEVDEEFWIDLLKKTESLRECAELDYVTFVKLAQFPKK